MKATVICEWPIDGPALSAAYSVVPEGRKGPCELILGEEKSPVFPNYEQAVAAASIAINMVVGGYGEVTVCDAQPGQVVTFETAQEWAYS